MNCKTVILLICTLSLANCQNGNPLMSLFSKFTGGGGGGSTGGSTAGGSSSGGGNMFNQLLGQLGLGNAGSALANSVGNTQREKEFNALLDDSYDTCSAKGYRKTDTGRTCPDTPTITQLIRERIPGEVRTIQRHVQKNDAIFGPFNDTLKHCEARLNDNAVSWADLNAFMSAKGNTSWQATPATKREWQATVTECGKLIAAERIECNKAMSILCAFSEGEHIACRPPTSLKRPPNPPNVSRAACDKIVQKLRTDALRERDANNERFW
jgi:hypothetical protein